jgi:hypothetical protein
VSERLIFWLGNLLYKLRRKIMQKYRQPPRMVVSISLLATFSLFSFVCAQTRPDSNQQIAPVGSHKLITVRLRLSNDREITVSQYDDEMITIARAGEMFGITPHVLDNGSVGVDFFDVARITTLNAGVGEKITSIGSMELNDTLPQSTPTDLISQIQVMRVSEVVKKYRPMNKSFCCITCDGLQTCGSSVEMSCGSCRDN